MTKTVKNMLDEAMAVVTTYNIAAARALHGQPDVVFVDLRDPR